MLSAWHKWAAAGRSEPYFDHMSDNAVFLGTDATERWTKEEFREFAKPYFDRSGQGAWDYRPFDRHIAFEADETVAWFDELLTHEKYGTARGTGVAVKSDDGQWRIAQYSLSFPIPNDLAGDFTKRIKRYEERRR